jgi:hypothetical protein
MTLLPNGNEAKIGRQVAANVCPSEQSRDLACQGTPALAREGAVSDFFTAFYVAASVILKIPL